MEEVLLLWITNLTFIEGHTALSDGANTPI